MADHPLRPARDRRLGRPLPHQLANPTWAHLNATGCPAFPPQGLRGISTRFQVLSPSFRQLPRYYSPVRRSRIAATARLACLRRAASVRSEPGSNSPSLNPGPKTGKRFQFQTLPTQQPPGCSPNICLYFSVRIIELTGSPHASLETLLQPTAFRQSLQLFFLTFSSLISL